MQGVTLAAHGFLPVAFDDLSFVPPLQLQREHRGSACVIPGGKT
jgi:hypothetical protein